MPKLYGQVEGMGSTLATRRGSKYIRASVQSYDGSVITQMQYEEDGLKVGVYVSDNSNFYGNCVFFGSLEELKKKLEA